MRPAPRESDLRRQAAKLMRSLGCEVYSLSQTRKSGIARGIPDVYVVPPRGKAPFWWEAKGAKGKPSSSQIAFRTTNACSDMVVVIGGLDELRSHLRQIGLLT